MGTAPPQGGRYGVLVPLKPTSVAKSRLAPLGDATRRALVAAFAMDTVAAALACPDVVAVVVVTEEGALARELSALGAVVVPDSAPGDLNGSLTLAAAGLLRRRPSLRPAALCGDLPALRPDHLSRVLAAAPTDRGGFVADLDDVGSTMVLAPSLEEFRPRFGPGSRGRHLAMGLVPLGASGGTGLRRDVDTPADLEAALRLGVGPRTAAAVRERLA